MDEVRRNTCIAPEAASAAAVSEGGGGGGASSGGGVPVPPLAAAGGKALTERLWAEVAPAVPAAMYPGVAAAPPAGVLQAEGSGGRGGRPDGGPPRPTEAATAARGDGSAVRGVTEAEGGVMRGGSGDLREQEHNNNMSKMSTSAHPVCVRLCVGAVTLRV